MVFSNNIDNFILFQFTCQVECEPSPKVAWYHNSKELIATSRIQISFDVTTRVTTLTIQGVVKPDEGDYVCRATNPLGEGTTRTVLHIKGKYFNRFDLK